MCTVTYIPTGNNQFYFTSNRDEFPNRSAEDILTKSINDKEILFPQDKKAFGTWIAIADSNQLVCILNGAFENHERKEPYRKSRGVMALEFFEFDSTKDFFKQYVFRGMEPFTMIIFDDGSLYEFRWDGQIKHVKSLSTATSHIWASATLYPQEWQEKRKQWFDEWKTITPIINQDSVLDFHNNAGEGNNRYDVKMYVKDIVQTTSITSVFHAESTFDMRYESVISKEVQFRSLNIMELTA